MIKRRGFLGGLLASPLALLAGRTPATRDRSMTADILITREAANLVAGQIVVSSDGRQYIVLSPDSGSGYTSAPTITFTVSRA